MRASAPSVLAHLVSSGFGYGTGIHNHRGPAKVLRPAIREYLADLDRVFEFTTSVFAGLPAASFLLSGS